MTASTPDLRRFSVHARHQDRHHARVFNEPSFEAAAIAFVEDLHLGAGEGDEVGLVVRDLQSGHEHAFRLHLGTGAMDVENESPRKPLG